MTHTIVLIQPNLPTTRTYSDYETVTDAMEGICALYEEQLKRDHPEKQSITYEIGQLYEWLDTLADISCLVYQKPTNTYAPYGSAWIKEKIYALLRNQAP